MASKFKNLLLQHLDPERISRLHLKRIDLPGLYDLEVPGRAIQHLSFVVVDSRSRQAG